MIQKPPKGLSTNSSDPDSTIRILLATDNHVGFAETDSLRHRDSFNTWREIVETAKNLDVDMMLLGGDLFHESSPSKRSMFEMIRSIRDNCMGSKPCSLQILSDTSDTFGDSSYCEPNFEDMNMNISLPIFTINGNHDDAAGPSKIAPLDILQAAGLVNYFGRVYEYDKIVVNPILIQKGYTKLALYGLSYCRDESLFKSFKNKQVTFMRPTEAKDEWFNLSTVHQNHSPHSHNAYLPESFLPSFLDFVFWGHEHECIPNPIWNAQHGFYVLQGGSSVATSLSMGESRDKHIYLLTLCRRQFRLEAIPLQTVRPFVMKDIVLSEVDELKNLMFTDNKSAVTQYLIEQCELAIEEANLKKTNETKDMLPLIRLRVEYSGGYEVENPHRFAQRFHDRIANKQDLLMIYLQKFAKPKINKQQQPPQEQQGVKSNADAVTDVDMTGIIGNYINQQNIELTSSDRLSSIFQNYIQKNESSILKSELSKIMDIKSKELDERLKLVAIDDMLTEQMESPNSANAKKRLTLARQLDDDDDNNDESADFIEQNMSVDDDEIVSTTKARAKPANKAARKKTKK